MKTKNIAEHRLSNQFLLNPIDKDPAEIVRNFVAVQAQDYLGSLWAIGLRQKHAVESEIERALADRSIVRTWPMRGTLHFVAAEDAKWLLKLLAPRVLTRAVYHYKQVDLDTKTLNRSKKLLVSILEKEKALTRTALYDHLESKGISTAQQRGLHIIGHLAQQGILCFGKREGKQQTFVLFDEWISHSRSLTGDDALAELTHRYFTGHGPATANDFAWWSGLTSAEARTCIEMVKSQLTSEVLNNEHYWAGSREAETPKKTTRLLPAWDEYTVAYKDRSTIVHPSHINRSAMEILNPVIMIDGRIWGTWSRTLAKAKVNIKLKPFEKLSTSQLSGIKREAGKYSKFLGFPLNDIVIAR